MNDWDIINRKEPREQVVTYKGIPCTARHCATNLNRLTKENEELKLKNNRYEIFLSILNREIEDRVYTLNKNINKYKNDDIVFENILNKILHAEVEHKKDCKLVKCHECKKSRSWGSNIWCGDGHTYIYHKTRCPHFESMHKS